MEEAREVNSESLRVDSYNTGTVKDRSENDKNLKCNAEKEIQIRNITTGKIG